MAAGIENHRLSMAAAASGVAWRHKHGNVAGKMWLASGINGGISASKAGFNIAVHRGSGEKRLAKVASAENNGKIGVSVSCGNVGVTSAINGEKRTAEIAA